MSEHSNTHLELHRNWLFGGYSADLSLTFDVTPIQNSLELNAVAHTLYSSVCKDGKFSELLNLKGRDPHQTPLLQGAPALNGEELFAVGGTIATSADADDFIWQPFHFACHTRFSRFEGSRTIVHSTHTTRTEAIPEWLPWWVLGSAAPIQPSFFRLGLEFFTSRFVITRLSFTPVVTETFLIDLVDDTLSISLRTEQPYWKPCNPFETNSVLRQFSLALEPITRDRLSTTFKRLLSAQASF